MYVNEIYRAISGESGLTGLPCLIIRMQGCNLKCNYCDTINWECLPNGVTDKPDLISITSNRHHKSPLNHMNFNARYRMNGVKKAENIFL